MNCVHPLIDQCAIQSTNFVEYQELEDELFQFSKAYFPAENVQVETLQEHVVLELSNQTR